MAQNNFCVAFFFFFLGKRNVGLDFLKLKLVFRYYKVQIAVLLRSVQRMTAYSFLNYLY